MLLAFLIGMSLLVTPVLANQGQKHHKLHSDIHSLKLSDEQFKKLHDLCGPITDNYDQFHYCILGLGKWMELHPQWMEKNSKNPETKQK